MLQIYAHAKVNLALNILGIRDDGYHELDMVMQSLELHDTLEMNVIPEEMGICLTCDGVPVGDENLVYRAARLLRDTYGVPAGMQIALKKAIPMQAGMGGGSADAAAALLGCCRLWGIYPSEERLVELALRLGADVPFCLVGGTARVSGFGETVQPVSLPFDGYVVVVHPGVGVSTPAAFRMSDSLGSGTPADISALLAGGQDWYAHMGNALEAAAVALCPAVAELKRDMEGTGDPLAVLMTGSGSAVFGLYSDACCAQYAAGLLRAKWPTVHVTRFAAAGTTVVSDR